jgi:hypothetical protein
MTDTLSVLIAVVVAGLVGYRLARLIAVDTITEPARMRLSRWAHAISIGGENPDVPNRPSKIRTWLFDLVTCVHCVGVWVTIPLSLIISAQLLDASIIVHLAIAVAATGLESYLASRS